MTDRNRAVRRHLNIEGVLRFALEHQDTPIVPGEANFQPMSEERRAWLTAALDFLASAESETDRLKACTEVLKKAETRRKELDIELYPDSDEDKKAVLNALEEAVEIIDQIDNARDFCSVGGFKYVANLIKDIRNDDIIIAACNVIATVVQNNPSCQEFALRCEIIQPLLNLLENSLSSDVKVKCVYGLSSLIRDNTKAQESFAEKDGYSVLVRALQVKACKLRIKIAFLLKALCVHQPEIKDILVRVGVVDHLAVSLEESHDSYHEHVISALLVAVDNHIQSLEACRQPHLELEKNLRSIKEELSSTAESREQHQEELRYCEQLLDACFNTMRIIPGER